MNLRQMFSIWRRRWVLTTALLMLALLGTAVATQVLPRYYQAQSTVTLLPSTNFSKANGNNPYLSFDGSLPVTAQLIGYQLMDPRTVQNLANEGYTASYSTALALNTTGPVLQTVVVGNNKALVEHTLFGATNQISSELAGLQGGITEKNKITVETLSFDPKPTLEISKSARPIVVVLFFGLALALAIPLVVDGQLGRSQKLAKSRKPARRAVRATAPAVPGPRTPAPSAPPAPAIRPEQATPVVTSAATPERADKPAEPDWASKLAEQEWASKPAGQEWLPATPTPRPERVAKPEWPAAPVPPPSRPEWVGKPSAPQAERNGTDTQNGAGTPARTEWPAKPAASLFGSERDEPAKPSGSLFGSDRDEPAEPSASLFGSDRDEPAKPSASLFERDRDEPAKPLGSLFGSDRDEPAKPAASRFQPDEPAKPASSRFQRDDEEPAKPASSRFRRDEEPAKPASSRFHKDDEEPAKPASSRFYKDGDEPAKPATPMPWDEDRAKDASPAGGGDKDSDGHNDGGQDHQDRETVTVPPGHTSADDLDDGPATQPQERVT
jgi:hypothetical protein